MRITETHHPIERPQTMREDNRKDYDSTEEKPKRKKFNLFNFLYERNAKKREDLVYDPNHKRDFLFFFRMLFDHKSNLFYINLMTVFGNFPIFLILLVFSGNIHLRMSAPADPLFAPIYGAMYFSSGSPSTAALFGVYGSTAKIDVWTPLTYIVLIVGLLLLAFTFGPVNVGTSYTLRNIVKGEPVFLWTDFWYAIKRNLKQEFVFGALDLGFLMLSVYDVYFFYINYHTSSSMSGMFSVFFCLGIFITITYLVMRFYIYLMMITFDLSIKKILKNAMIFTIIGFKRNIVALFGIAAAVFLNYVIATVYPPIGIILPFIITVSLCSFMAAYAAWPKIKEIMIDPYADENQGEIQEA